jgi:hypothetical protein
MPGGGRKPGVKFGGRQKGTRNAVTIQTREELMAYCKSIDGDPGKIVADLMVRSKDKGTKIRCAELLLDRLLPKLKSVEVTGDQSKPLYIVTDGVTASERAARQAKIEELLAKRGAENATDSI